MTAATPDYNPTELLDQISHVAPIKHLQDYRRVEALVYGRSRAFEWYAATCIFGWGLILFYPGDSLSASPWLFFPWTEMRTAFTMTGVGGIWLAALYINGNWRHSPTVRSFAACVGASIFALLSGTLYFASRELGYLSTGFFPYGLMAGFCIYCAYRAGQDVKLLNN